MSNNSAKPEELVFYVDKDSDDFTFYLERDEANTVVDALLPNKRLSQETETAEKDTFTVSEEVVVKSLILTKDNLKAQESFWKNLKRPRAGSPHRYLRSKLDAKLQSKHKNNGQLRECLEALDNGSLDNQTQKLLLTAIVESLNNSIRTDKLESQAWAKVKLPVREDALIETLPDEKTKKRWRNRFFVQRAFNDLIKETQTGRGLICFSYVGKYLSVTFRRLTSGRGYEPDKSTNRTSYLFSLAEYCELIYEEVFKTTNSTEHAHGLLVITGSTKSAKSEIARALIHLYLTRKKNRKRTPHLVTFEDPVERFYSYEMTRASDPWMAIERSKTSVIDYTPRQKGKDVSLLKDALTDALRQTPAAFFVGETRDKDEWELLLDFAATGHLIVTTAHASSLVEAMHKIFEAREVNTPAERSEIANKLFGLIHLRMGSIVVNEEGDTAEALFPALWRRTGRGIASLTSDGLASLLPHRAENKDSGGPSCLGRRWLIDCLIRSAADDLANTFPNFSEPFEQSLKLRLCKRATEWDLEGV